MLEIIGTFWIRRIRNEILIRMEGRNEDKGWFIPRSFDSADLTKIRMSMEGEREKEIERERQREREREKERERGRERERGCAVKKMDRCIKGQEKYSR